MYPALKSQSLQINTTIQPDRIVIRLSNETSSASKSIKRDILTNDQSKLSFQLISSYNKTINRSHNCICVENKLYDYFSTKTQRYVREQLTKREWKKTFVKGAIFDNIQITQMINSILFISL